MFLAESTFHASPFTSEPGSPTPASVPHAHQRPISSQHREEIALLTRSATLRDMLSAVDSPLPEPDHFSQSTKSRQNSLRPLRLSPSQVEDPPIHTPSSVSHGADTSLSLLDPQFASRYNLTMEQVEVINRLGRDSVSMEMIAHIIEGFSSSNISADGTNDRRLDQERSFSPAPPPSYKSQDHDD